MISGIPGRNIAWLWTGRFISQAGDKFYAIALAWWLLAKTGSAMVMAAFLVASMLPGLLVGPLAGPLLDRVNQKALLVAADLVRCAVVSVLVILSLHGGIEVWHVIGAASLLSVASAFFDPASQAIIPKLVAEEELPKANALLQTTGGACMVLGPALGAACVSAFGYTTVFVLNAASFAFCAFCVSRLRMQQTAIMRKSAPRYLQALKEGFLFVMGHRRLLVIIGAVGLAHFFTAGLVLTLPFLASSLPGAGVRTFGFLEMAIGCGFLVGSLGLGLRGKARPHEERLFPILFGAGICMTAIGLLRHTPAGMVPHGFVLAVYGFMIVNASVVWQCALQGGAPEHLAGRVFSLSSLAANLSMPLAYGIFGSLLTRDSMPVLLLASGACLILLSAFLGLAFRRSERMNAPMEPQAQSIR